MSYKIIFSTLMTLMTLMLFTGMAFSQNNTYLLYDDFRHLSNWSNDPNNCPGFETVTDGEYVYPVYGSCSSSDQWEGVEFTFPAPILPSYDFIFKYHVSVLTDQYGHMGGVGLRFLDEYGNIVADLKWYEPQAGTGYGGVNFYAEGNKIYGGVSGFESEYPTIDDFLELRRSGNTWSAWVGSTQKGSDLILPPTQSISKVQLIFYNFVNWSERDIKVDNVSVQVFGGLEGNVCCIAEGSYSEEQKLASLLTENGLIPEFHSALPTDLSPYCIIILTNHSYAGTAIAPILKDYVYNGGGLITNGYIPLKLAGSTNFSQFGDWFGASYYVNSNGCSVLQVDDALGCGLPPGTILFYDNVNSCNYGASVGGLKPSAVELAHWECGCSPQTTAFINEYGSGRIYYSQELYDHPSYGRPEMLELTSAVIRWTGESCFDETYNVFVDIKPGSCPNPLNVKPYRVEESAVDNTFAKLIPDLGRKPNAVLPVAILGTAEFDVSEIDPSTIKLEGVPVLRWNYEDVGTPIDPDATECECNELGYDGYTDITLKFDKAAIIEALGEVSNGDEIALTITGQLYDGTEIEGKDCAIIKAKRDSEEPYPTSKGIPETYSLGQNYPNPFNPETEISYGIPKASNVNLEIFNITGQKVVTLVDRHQDAGTYTVRWNGSSVASGIYFYRIRTDKFTETKRMVLLK